MKIRSALAGSALVAGLLACTAGSAGAASDPGWFAGHSSEERQAIVNYVYERTGHEPPYTGDAAALGTQVADSMVDAGEDDSPLAPAGGALELVVGTRVGLMTRLTTMVPTLWAVGGTFVAGYAIGTGVRKLFATLSGPGDAGTGGAPGWSWGSVSWRPAGYEILYGARVQQSPGAYLYDDGGGVIRWFEQPCSFSGFTPAAGARMQYGVASTATCREWVRDVGPVDFPVFVDYPYLLESDIQPTAPLRPFDEATDDVDSWESYPPNPGATAVERGLGVLDEDGNDLLRSQIDWALTPGAQPEEEPVRAGTRLSDEDRACKDYFDDAPQPDPGARSPDADPEAADWDHDVEQFTGVLNPAARATQTVKLRWGTRAWGYRHIVLGHGWDSAAASRTALALRDPSPSLSLRDPARQSFVYQYTIPGLPAGMQCMQRVVVSFGATDVYTEGRHVITSFVVAG